MFAVNLAAVSLVAQLGDEQVFADSGSAEHFDAVVGVVAVARPVTGSAIDPVY